MEENNRQRVLDNANKPLEECDLTAVTSSNEEHQRSLVQTNVNIDLLRSSSAILPSYLGENSTVTDTNSLNVPSTAKPRPSEVSLIIDPVNTGIDHGLFFNIGTKERETDLLNLLNVVKDVKSETDECKPLSRPITHNEPDLAQNSVVDPPLLGNSLSDCDDNVANKEDTRISIHMDNVELDLGQSEFDDLLTADLTAGSMQMNNVGPLPIVETVTDATSLINENPSIPDIKATDKTEENDVTNDEEVVTGTETNPGPVHTFDGQIQEITGAWEEFQAKKGECFTKGCKWSPDGTCLLTNSDDNVLRIFDLPTELHCQESWAKEKRLPEMRPVLKMAEGGLIYDYCWYPLMSSWDPLSCCLVSTAQDNPVHLWDAFTGALRATYRAYNQVDEVEAAHCVAFDRHGDKLYCGFKNVVRVFNTAIPGRNCETRYLKDANVAESQRGIISCITVNPAMPNIYAIGSYLKSVGLYSEPRGSALCLMTGHVGGVTHLAFSPDGTQLFSGGRKDPDIICWDIRNPGHVLFTMERKVSTNQRIQFDVTPDGRYLVSGGSDGVATVWDLLEPPSGDAVLPARQKLVAHKDCANGVSIHQQYPILATSSGQRHFAELSRNSDDSDDGSPLLKRKYIARENCVKLWWTGKMTE